jgi:hypothetical protein
MYLHRDLKTILTVLLIAGVAILASTAAIAQSGSANAGFLNEMATNARDKMPRKIDIFVIHKIYSSCPSGCEVDFADTHLSFDAWMPDHANANISLSQVDEHLSLAFAKDYCESKASEIGVYIRIYVKDKNGKQTGSRLIDSRNC